MKITCGENNPCSNIKNSVSYKKEKSYNVIAKIAKEDFVTNYSTQYGELIGKIKVLYEDYVIVEGQEENNEDYEFDESDNYQDVEYNPPDEFINRVRDIVERNKRIYEKTYEQIDKYTSKIPAMPWALGCTIKGLVMYILHNPIIKCAVQYFDNYKYTKDETGETFEKMVKKMNESLNEKNYSSIHRIGNLLKLFSK